MAQSGFYLLLSVRCCAPVSLAAPPRSGRPQSPVQSHRLPAVVEENFSGCPHLCLTDALEEGVQERKGRGKWHSDGSLPSLNNFKISVVFAADAERRQKPAGTVAIFMLSNRPFSLSGALFDLLPLYESLLCALLLQLEEKNILMARSIQEHGRR